MKKIAILGSSGSIGKSTLDVVRSLPHKFKVEALSVNSDIATLIKQVREFKPRFVCVRDKTAAQKLKSRISSSVKILSGDQGLGELLENKQIKQVMFAISGSAALAPLIKAIKEKKDIALANKEAIVMAGSMIMDLAKRQGVKIMPVDSEQSAIWQGLGDFDSRSVKKIYLTASGGPLRKVPSKQFKNITINRVLCHPRWKMGKKITVDSATLMNKGLELLEAMFLFNLEVDKIKILIHPEALIHSMVEFTDGVIIAQLSITDMRIPIQYALSYPERMQNSLAGIDFDLLRKLHFEKPDLKKFPCLRLAYQAASELGTMPAVMNAANEECVNNFLNKKISFLEIPKIVEKVMRSHKKITKPALDEIIAASCWASDKAASLAG